MLIVIEALKKSFKAFRSHWHSLPLAALFDMLFFFLFGIGGTFVASFTASPITTISQSAARLNTEIAKAFTEGKDVFNLFLSDPGVVLSIKTLLGLGILFGTILYLFWVLFSGGSWAVAYSMTGHNKPSFFKYVLRFSVISAVWFGIFSVVYLIYARFVFFSLFRPEPLFTVDNLQLIATISNIILFYFLFISLSLVPFTKTKHNFAVTFTKGITKMSTFVFAYGLVLLALYLNFEITYLIFNPIAKNLAEMSLGIYAINFVRFIIAAPFLTWARMFMMFVARKFT